jgi:hypothetical protein
MLYCSVAPNGAVTTMVPVGTAHVGCVVAVALAAAGGGGTALIIATVGLLTQPVAVFLTRTL